MILEDEERQRRLSEIRKRVRTEARREPVVEVVAVEEEEPTKVDRTDRRRRREESNPESIEDHLGDSESEEIAVQRVRRERLERTIELGGEVPTVRRAAVILIVAGSMLGLFFGGLLFSADPSDLLGGLELTTDSSPSVSGIVHSSLDSVNGTGGEEVSGAEVVLLDPEGQAILARTFTGEDGRFLFEDVTEPDVALEVRHSGNVTERRLIQPGRDAQLVITLSSGSGTNEIDLRTESHLADSVALGTAISAFTVTTALLGLVAAHQAHRAIAYRRTQILCGLALFSRGGIFIGPGLILAGMLLLKICRGQFADRVDNEDQPESLEG